MCSQGRAKTKSQPPSVHNKAILPNCPWRLVRCNDHGPGFISQIVSLGSVAMAILLVKWPMKTASANV